MQEKRVLVGGTRTLAMAAALAMVAGATSAMPYEPPAAYREPRKRKKNSEQSPYAHKGRLKQGGRKHAKGRKFKGSKAAKKAARKRG